METQALAELIRRARNGYKNAQQSLDLDSAKSVFYFVLKMV